MVPMLVWEKITYPFKTLNGKEISKKLVHERFMNQGIKACDIEDTVGYLSKKLECSRDCSQCLLFYLEQSLVENNKGIEQKLNTSENKSFKTVIDEFGQEQFKLF